MKFHFKMAKINYLLNSDNRKSLSLRKVGPNSSFQLKQEEWLKTTSARLYLASVTSSSSDVFISERIFKIHPEMASLS